MIHDLVRTACVIAAMAAAASIVVETRARLAAIDAVYRQAAGWHAAPQPVAAAQPHDGPLARLGRATVGLADAALGVVR